MSAFSIVRDPNIASRKSCGSRAGGRRLATTRPAAKRRALSRLARPCGPKSYVSDSQQPRAALMPDQQQDRPTARTHGPHDHSTAPLRFAARLPHRTQMSRDLCGGTPLTSSVRRGALMMNREEPAAPDRGPYTAAAGRPATGLRSGFFTQERTRRPAACAFCQVRKRR